MLSCGDEKGPRTIVFRIDPERTEQLLASDSRFQRYPFEKSALSIEASDVDDWDQLRTFVEESYRREAEPSTAKAARPRARKRTAAKRPRTRGA